MGGVASTITGGSATPAPNPAPGSGAANAPAPNAPRDRSLAGPQSSVSGPQGAGQQPNFSFEEFLNVGQSMRPAGSRPLDYAPPSTASPLDWQQLIEEEGLIFKRGEDKHKTNQDEARLKYDKFVRKMDAYHREAVENHEHSIQDLHNQFLAEKKRREEEHKLQIGKLDTHYQALTHQYELFQARANAEWAAIVTTATNRANHLKAGLDAAMTRPIGQQPSSSMPPSSSLQATGAENPFVRYGPQVVRAPLPPGHSSVAPPSSAPIWLRSPRPFQHRLLQTMLFRPAPEQPCRPRPRPERDRLRQTRLSCNLHLRQHRQHHRR